MASGGSGGGELECRICMMPDEGENLIEPCGCKGGSRYAHYTCIQTWILTDKTCGIIGEQHPREPMCEVCGEAWKGDFKLPPPPGRKRTPAEELAVVRKAIASSWLRVQAEIPRPHDEDLLYRVAPLVKGPWDESVAELVKKKDRAARWEQRKSSVMGFLTLGRRNSAPEPGSHN